MVRGALWLVNEVGVGNTFTKTQLREAFPGVSQIDRRIRDLRDYGWVIRSNTEDASLRPEEQRFVQAGLRVWEPGERRKGGPSTLTAKERRTIFERDAYQCTVCGIAGGERYPDRDYETAVLAVVRSQMADDSTDTNATFFTECRRCKAGNGAAVVPDVSVARATIRMLPADDRQRLKRWILRGRRGPTSLDRAWTTYRLLSVDERDRIARELD